MRLIATIGANRLSHAHIYKLKNKSYKSQLSFLALAEALKITDRVGKSETESVKKKRVY